MKYLLDTCALIALVEHGKDFTPAARQKINAPGAEIFLSVISAVELSIKTVKGKIVLSEDTSTWIKKLSEDFHVDILPLDLESAAGVEKLPLLHADPFDRILVSTALHHDFTLVTFDRIIPTYPGVKTLW